MYELETQDSMRNLVNTLKEIGIHKIKQSGFNYLIETPGDIDGQKLLNQLINAKNPIEINYFRNISESSRSLFTS